MTNAPAYIPKNDHAVLGVIFMILFCVTAPILDVFAKLAAEKIPVGQITAARFLVQAILMVPLAYFYDKTLTFRPKLLSRLVFRSLMLVASTYCFVAAIAVMPIADALAIVFVEPFILLLIGKYIYAEEVGPRRLTASIIGFLGVILIIQPSFVAFGWITLFPLGTALCFALYMISTRSLSRHMNTIAMQAHTAWIGAAIVIPVIVLADGSGITAIDPVMPNGVYWWYLIGMGIAATVAHLFMSYALSVAPSSTLAPLHYLEIVSAVILGYIIFSDIPNASAVAGMLIVMSCGLYIVYREQKIARQTQL